MYTYEERLRAVKLYLSLGKRCKATIQKLGYPTKNALKAWHNEFERLGDLQAGYTRSKPKYSEEQKNTAVKHWENNGRCFSFTLDELGYPSRQTLTAWVCELYPETRKYVTGIASNSPVFSPIKRRAVYELCTRTGSAQELADRLDVDRTTLYNWKNQLLGREAPALMKSEKTTSAADIDKLEKQVEILRRDIRNLQLEHDLLNKANDLLKKDLGVDMQAISNREKTMLVDALKETYGLSELFSRLGLARSSYF